MNLINSHLNKNSLHHAYLIEGDKDAILPEILSFLKESGFPGPGHADFSHLSLDSFKIEDARNLKSFASEKNSSAGKRIFIVSANSFLLEAQNTMLKMFEEPIEDTIFFLIVPDKNALLRTLVSRFYVISAKGSRTEENKKAEEFLKLSLTDRLEFVKELLIEEESEEEAIDSPRAKSLIFLNSLEYVLHEKAQKDLSAFPDAGFEHFFKVRKFLRMPGSSAKSLMESVALIIPNL